MKIKVNINFPPTGIGKKGKAHDYCMLLRDYFFNDYGIQGIQDTEQKEIIFIPYTSIDYVELQTAN